MLPSRPFKSGKEEGVLEGERKTLLHMLQRRFNSVPDWAVEKILNGTAADLEHWLDNVLDATGIESVFTEQTASH